MEKSIAAAFAAAAALSMAAAPANADMHQANTNSESYWESQLGLECMKYDDLDQMYWTTPVDGTVVVKGGSVDSGHGRGIAVLDVRAGDVVSAPLNAGGKQAAISWLIVCEDDQDYSS